MARDDVVETATRLDDFVSSIIQHEGLVPGQTPARITSPAMAKWNTYLGFKVKKGPKPPGRENFIFLENPEDVPRAVRKQIERYLKFPSKFRLSNNPTIQEAVEVFDQTGSQGKLQFLQQRGFNVIDPLASLFNEEVS